MTETEQLIVRVLAGEATPAERETLQQWLAQSDEHREQFAELEAAWQQGGLAGQSFQPNVAAAQAKFEANWQAQQPAPPSARWISWAVAASIAAIIAVGSAFWLTGNSPDTITVAAAATQTVTLPDGSHVTLRSGSQLAYPANFATDRTISLSGEAFFDVVRDTLHPFTIFTGSSQTTVLGTSFNLCEIGEEVQLAVTSGKVAFGDTAETQHQHFTKAMYASTKNGLTQPIEPVSPNQFAWRTNKLVFKQAALHQVAADLSKYYRTSVRLSCETVGFEKVTATFSNQSLEQVMDELEVILEVTITKTNSGYTIAGPGCNDYTY